MNLQNAIRTVTEGQDLTYEQMQTVMQLIMTGSATPSQVAGFLVGLRMKGETVAEISGAVTVMRRLATRVKVNGQHRVDTCGTGGDGAGIFNISTTSALIAAAAGCQVSKHGNRSISSHSGSADVLEAAGVNLQLPTTEVEKCIEQTGIGFMFAPVHHRSMKYAIQPRREMGIRTLFNILGPLTNPADAPNQVLGVFSNVWLNPLAEVLRQLGSHHVILVHGEDGLDEITITGKTYVTELIAGKIREYIIDPEDFGLQKQSLQNLKVADANSSLKLMKQVLQGNDGPAADIVSLNAGAAIYAANLTDSLATGIIRAQDVIRSGAGMDKLQSLIATSNKLKH